MTRNKNAKYTAKDIHGLVAAAVENARARRLNVLSELELSAVTGGLAKGPSDLTALTQTSGAVPTGQDEFKLLR